ncbi:MAG: 4-hydroxy-3-methylbut-2-enyl diphosphate reductase [Planctomycetes bacterium]|nr:4-hydroxy-3-methylbut-2-enyl diphosphate reductase [Planctomycetota bacterium]
MQILRAQELGMCFGVRDALAVLDREPAPADVTIHGELVHNPEVLALLDRRGFHRSGEAGRAVPATPVVAVTAHGISDRERAALLAAGKRLVDTTCPLVRKAHDAAQALAGEGRRVVVLGKRDHVEVRGLTDDLVAPIVVGGLGDVTTWPDARLGVVCQTTTQDEVAQELLAAIRRRNPHADVRFVDTVCAPTKARIQALLELLPHVDAMVVVGGHDSNNTRQLVLRAEHHGVRTCHVAHARELHADWFAEVRRCGLTAGTSTLPKTVEEVHGWLVRLAAGRVKHSA